MVAPIMGPTLGGYITDNWNWRWNFYINVPIEIGAAFMVSTFVQDPSYLRKLKGQGRADWLGIVCLVLALGLGEIVMDRGDRADWFASSWVWYFSLIAGGAFILLIWHEWRTPEPIVQVRILKNRNFSVPTILLILMTFTSYGMQILNPAFLQDLLGYTAARAGMVMAPRGIGLLASMFLLGGIAKRGIDTRPLVAFGFVLIGVASWQLGSLDLNMSQWDFAGSNRHPGGRDGLDFPEPIGDGAKLHSARADGLCNQPLFDVAQYRRIDRHLGADHDARAARADSAELPGAASVGIRRLAVEQRARSHTGGRVAFQLHEFAGKRAEARLCIDL